MATGTVQHKKVDPFGPLLIGGAGLVSFGLTMLVMSVFYIEDLAMLQAVPSMVYQFVCGAPVENGIILPGLITMGGGSILLGVILGGAHIIRARHRARRG